jgi:hypothetical protein
VDVGFGVELLAGQVRGSGEAVGAVGRRRFGEIEDERGRPDRQVARRAWAIRPSSPSRTVAATPQIA